MGLLIVILQILFESLGQSHFCFFASLILVFSTFLVFNIYQYMSRSHENTDGESGVDDDTQSSCVTTSTQNLDNVSADGFSLPLDLKETCADLASKKAMVEEIYADMMNRKLEFEEKIIEISQYLSGSMEKLKEQIEEPKNKPETVMGSTKAPPPPTLSVTEKETKEVEQKKKKQILYTYTKAKARAGKSTTKAIEELKRAFKLCKLRQSFLWPNKVMSPKSQPQVKVNVPTPSSVSTSKVSVKPLAQRPLVTIASKPASHSLIHLYEPPSSSITAISCGLGKEEEDHQMRQCERQKNLRHESAVLNMLKILKEKEAVFGKPILRAALREEVRKVIGDTALVDHLLEYIAGKVAPGGEYRFMRRYNADGAMEYWLESSDLANIRKKAGVDDHYWTPPPGWNPSDCPNQDPVRVSEFKQLKEETQQTKRDMQKDDLSIGSMTAKCFCVTSTQNSENASADGFLLQLNLNLEETCADLVSKKAKVEEMYADVMNSKVEIDEKMMEISQSLSGSIEKLKASMELPNNKPETGMRSTKAPPPPPPTLSVTEKETKQVEEKKKNKILLTYRKAKERACYSTTTKTTKTTIMKNFKICKLRQSFLCMSPQPQTKVIVPTPSSVSSSKVLVEPLAQRPLVTVASKPASHSLINLNEPASSNVTAISCGLHKDH